MAQIKDEKISDISLNGPNAHHGPNANHKPKEEFHGGGRGGRGNRFQPYGGPNRDRKSGPPRDNNMVNIKVVIKCSLVSLEFSIFFSTTLNSVNMYCVQRFGSERLSCKTTPSVLKLGLS